MTESGLRFSYDLPVDDAAPADYPQQHTPDVYASQTWALAYNQRRAALLDHYARQPAPHNTKALHYEMTRLATGKQPHPGILRASLDFINQRRDCADFVLHAGLRLLYQFADHPAMDIGWWASLRQTVLDFKYWPDEPGSDSLCTWTENHQVLFASAAMLAGQLFPDEQFSNSGTTGREQIARHKPRLLRWLDLRFQTGFSEWLSHIYYDEDLTALLNLADFCADDELAGRSRQVIDLLLLDMALNSTRGTFGSTHGRSYELSKKSAWDENTVDTQKLVFGMGVLPGRDSMGAIHLALSTTYRPPAVLAAIAQDVERPVMENRQRLGFTFKDAKRLGLGFEDVEDGMRWLSMEAYTHPRTINLTMRLFDAFNWWQNGFFTPFAAQRTLVTGLRRLGLLPALAHLLEWDITRNMRPAANVITRRTPHYMLSCAQDYRPGFGGDQQHIWQATFGPQAVVFTTHPGREGRGMSPDRWTGSGVLPRAIQTGSLVVCIYNLQPGRPALYLPTQQLWTQAWLPRAAFDEVVEKDGWVFARHGQGYLALTCSQPLRWEDKPGPDQGKALIAEGTKAVWLCEAGSQDECESFEQFMAQTGKAQLHFEDLAVTYASPWNGRVAFGWRGGLTIDGKTQPQPDYPRYDNPYVQAAYPSQSITVRLGEHFLELDHISAGRRFDRPVA